MPVGVATTGHVAGERLERGQAEAFVLGGHERRVDCVHVVDDLVRRDAAEREEFEILDARGDFDARGRSA